jgi:hypothetical protein
VKPAVLGFERDRLKDQQVQGPLDQIGGFGHMPRLCTIVDDHGIDLVSLFPEQWRLLPCPLRHCPARLRGHQSLGTLTLYRQMLRRHVIASYR